MSPGGGGLGGMRGWMRGVDGGGWGGGREVNTKAFLTKRGTNPTMFMDEI
jgi:hypothetical protein